MNLKKEIIPLLKGKQFWWMDIVFYFFIALLILTIIFYFVLDIEISRQNRKIEKSSQEIAKFGTPEQKELERKVFGYEAKIKEVRKLVETHKITSNFFALMEKTTLEKVYFPTMSLDVTKPETKLSGQTEDFKTLAQQLFTFEENEDVTKINTFNGGLDEKTKITFGLTLILSPDLFIWK